MAKEAAILGVSILTLFVAGFAAYSIYDSNGVSSAEAAVKDYTGEFESIQTALSEVNQKLEDLESDTIKELQKIKVELEEVKAIGFGNEVIDTSSPFSISLDKTTYPKSGVITVFAHNILPQKVMTIQLISKFDELITTVTARSDSTGKLDHIFQIPSFVPAGDYKIKATTSYGSSSLMFFKISDDIISKPTNPSIQGLSVILDNSVYNPGDMIKVTGFGEKSTSITAQITSPNNKVSTAHSSTSSDSTYTLIFILDKDAKVGNWKLKVTNGDHEETLSFTVKN
jgi:hypothetical protein